MMNSKILLLAAVITLSMTSVAQAGRDDAGDRAFDRAIEAEEQPREVASDFTNDYLDSIADEKANENTIAQKDAEDHDKFLRSMKGNGR